MKETNINDFLMNSLYINIKKIDFIDICSNKILFFGSNLLNKFDTLMCNLVENNKDFHGLIFADDYQSNHVEMKWSNYMDIIPWKGSYDSVMLNNDMAKNFLSSNGIILYCGSNPVNYRDINIYEIGIRAKNEMGTRLCIYDYNQECLFEYNNLELLIRGMKLYTEINEYIYDVRKVWNL